jgi:hypothetical protein
MSGPSENYGAITPSDTGPPTYFAALYVGTTGNVTAVRATGGMPNGIAATSHANEQSNPAVLTVPSGHGFVTGDVVRLVNATGGTWNSAAISDGIFTVTATSTTLTFTGLNGATYGNFTSATVTGVGRAVLFSNVPVGVLPISGLRVNSTETTATNLVGL